MMEASGFTKRQKQNISAQTNGNVNEAVPVQQNGRETTTVAESSSRALTRETYGSIIRIWAPTLLFIFGGCCSNVYTLESLVSASPSSGTLITALQFVITTLLTLPSHVSWSRGWRSLFLLPSSIPLTKWLIYTAFFLTINILNNTAFDYHISVPLHIILRSAGPVSTMLVGRLYGKRSYPPLKILSVILLFAGVVLAAASDAYAKQPDTITSKSSTTTPSQLSTQLPGFALLSFALLLSAFMGLYTDTLYTTYGRSAHITSETLFYSHTLSLPYFLYQIPTLYTQLLTLTTTSPNLHTHLPTTLPSPTPITPRLHALPTLPTIPLTLLLNALTQYICISGVNRLATQSSSLTVSIILNIRKLVSLLLSIWLFGNALPLGVIVGACVVAVGGGLYAVPTKPRDTDGGRKQQGGRKLERERKGTEVREEEKKEL